jgi:biotin carboxyl carrier protein
VAALSRRLRVGPTATSGLPDDPVRELDLDAPDAAGVTRSGRDELLTRIARHDGEGQQDPAAIAVLAAPLGRLASGALLVEAVADGWRFELEVEDAARAVLRRRATRDRETGPASGPMEIRAIIPGRVVAVRVVTGDAVETGTSLIVVEAMKMQNELRAPRSGVVDRVAVAVGQTIDPGDVLVVLR